MTSFAQRQVELNRQLREEKRVQLKKKWSVEIRQGYTDRVIETHGFSTFEGAETFYQSRRLTLKFSGTGDQYQRYVTYPVEVK